MDREAEFNRIASEEFAREYERETGHRLRFVALGKPFPDAILETSEGSAPARGLLYGPTPDMGKSSRRRLRTRLTLVLDKLSAVHVAWPTDSPLPFTARELDDLLRGVPSPYGLVILVDDAAVVLLEASVKRLEEAVAARARVPGGN